MEKMTTVQWSELFPYQLLERMGQCPVVYLPLGLCEPHGQIAAYGLDLIKAEYLCRVAASRYGGVVAPSLGYQMHETGPHAGWLEQEIGDANPRMTSMPPHVLLLFYLYQLRSFHNAGFSAAFILTGHAGGNERDLRMVSGLFEERFGMKVVVHTDSELAADKFRGDHAGKYEISQLMAIRSDLVDLSLACLAEEPYSDGHLAIGQDAHEANAEYGEQALEAALECIGKTVVGMFPILRPINSGRRITIDEMEQLWEVVYRRRQEWFTAKPRPGNLEVRKASQWKAFELPYE